MSHAAPRRSAPTGAPLSLRMLAAQQLDQVLELGGDAARHLVEARSLGLEVPVEHHGAERGPADVRPRRRDDFEQVRHDDIRDDVRDLVGRLKQRGLETIVLDHTRPDVGFPVARVVVPGLRHFWVRLAPGRLYDVPVAQGWVKQARTEDELNPIPFFL